MLAWRREQGSNASVEAAERRHRRLAIVAVAALLALAAMTAWRSTHCLSDAARRAADTAHARELVARSSSLVARSSALLAQDPLRGACRTGGPTDPTAAAETAPATRSRRRGAKILQSRKRPRERGGLIQLDARRND